MTSKVFTPGTVIDSNWLNDVNEGIYNTLPGKISAVSPVLTTPNIGNATAVTVNGITFTQSTGTLTIPNGTTATVSGVNTGDQNLTTYAQYGTNNTWTANNTFNGPVAFGNTATFGAVTTNVMYNSVLGAYSSGGTITLNTALASTFGFTVSSAVAIVFAGNPPALKDQTIYIKIANGGSASVTWPTGTRFPGGTPPTLTTSGNDLLSAWYDPDLAKWVVGMVWKDYR